MLNKAIKLVVLSVVYFPLSLVFLVARVRLIVITSPDRIGHLCVEPDTFLKERYLGLQTEFAPVFLIPMNRVANHAVLGMWQKKLRIITSPMLCRILVPFKRFNWAGFPAERYAVAIDSTATSPAIMTAWGDRPPLLMLDEEQRTRGIAALEKLGVPRDAWFVCVHSRDGAYSPADEHLHSYRNCSIENYRLAVREIVERGGWCLRVGEPSSASLPSERGLVDYANLVGGAKPIPDNLIRLGYLKDDSPRWFRCEYLQTQVPKKDERTELEFVPWA